MRSPGTHSPICCLWVTEGAACMVGPGDVNADNEIKGVRMCSAARPNNGDILDHSNTEFIDSFCVRLS
jgi:hypothetical protein